MEPMTGLWPCAGRPDPRLTARVVSRRELRYDEGADAAQDRPAHVRAGSGLAWARTPAGERLVVVQDDASFLALVDPHGGLVGALALPPGPGGARQFDEPRGTKRLKLDLEACLTLDDDAGEQVVLALGSGSTDRRERVAVARGLAGAPDVTLVDARALYAALRATRAFAGSELNVEGAARLGDDVVLFQRGNGAPRGELLPVDATARLDRAALLAYLRDPSRPPPPVREVAGWDLGRLHGVRLTFTDAATRPGDARAWFLAAAEDSPDTYRDGPVVGVVVGVIEVVRGVTWARWARVTDGDQPWLAKAEGLALDPRDPSRAWVVVDRDDPTAAAELCELRLEGPWAPSAPQRGVVRVVSGGQTGVDRAALDAALDLGLAHGGWCPRGRAAEDGPIDARYALVETASVDPAERTRRNVELADATLVFTRGPAAGGTALTREVARAHARPHLAVDLAQADVYAVAREVGRWLDDVQPATLNVAGPRESESSGIGEGVRQVLHVALGPT